jgi:hypothetical protein
MQALAYAEKHLGSRCHQGRTHRSSMIRSIVRVIEPVSAAPICIYISFLPLGIGAAFGHEVTGVVKGSRPLREIAEARGSVGADTHEGYIKWALVPGVASPDGGIDGPSYQHANVSTTMRAGRPVDGAAARWASAWTGQPSALLAARRQ